MIASGRTIPIPAPLHEFDDGLFPVGALLPGEHQQYVVVGRSYYLTLSPPPGRLGSGPMAGPTVVMTAGQPQ
jgi:hypothetical protein